MPKAKPDIPAPFDSQPWTKSDLIVPGDADAVPTMLTPEEGDLLHWLARDYVTGAGVICDLGCFAGGSTARLASGVMAAGRDTKVHAFDHFTLTEDQKERYLYPAGVAPFEGADMVAAVRRLLKPWQDIVALRRGDITEVTWHDGPIEILFIDAAKTPASADDIARIFMPHLIPGRSIVVQQDYLHWRQPWVPAQMELLSDCFQMVGWCAKNTVIFRATKSITDQTLAQAKTSNLEDADLIHLNARALRRFPGRPQRAHVARAIMGVQDNPGIREPHRMARQGFSPKRVTAVIQETMRSAH